MRAFVGAPLGDDAVTEIERLQEGLGTGRPVAAENLHVTLAFLDEQPVAALEAVHEGLTHLLPTQISLRFCNVEVKGGRKPSLAWATVADDPRLSALREKVRRVVRQAGIDLRRERFRPHVTLARFGRSSPANERQLQAWLVQNAGFRAGPFPLNRVCLYQSVLTPSGPIYTVMAEYPMC